MLVMDYESKLFVDAAKHVLALWSPDDMATAERHLRDRADMVRSGVLKCPEWFQIALNKIDTRLRCWWDAWKEEWVIDRLQDEGIVEGLLRMSQSESQEYKKSLKDSASGILAFGRYYLTVMHFKPKGEFQLNQKLLDALQEGDMQRYYSPAEFMKKREALAAQKEKSNEAAATDKVLAAVDSLSDRQLHDLRLGLEALGTGETITFHGEDAKFMESIQEARKKAPPMPVNKPDVFRPKRKGYK